MVLLLIRSQVDVPIIAAGIQTQDNGRGVRFGRRRCPDGNTDGRCKRIAGARQLETAIVSAAETDTIFLNEHRRYEH